MTGWGSMPSSQHPEQQELPEEDLDDSLGRMELEV